MKSVVDVLFQEEKFDAAAILAHLQAAKSDFPESSSLLRAKDLSEKWAMYANAITARDVRHNLVGLVLYYSNQPPIAYTTHVWVDKSMRGKGLCGRMLKYLERACIEDGFTEHRLEVAVGNVAAISAYRKFGFVEVERRTSSMILCKPIS